MSNQMQCVECGSLRGHRMSCVTGTNEAARRQIKQRAIYTQAELDAELERVRRETLLETFRIFTDAAAEFLGRTKVDKIIGGALKAARDAALSAGKGATSEEVGQ